MNSRSSDMMDQPFVKQFRSPNKKKKTEDRKDYDTLDTKPTYSRKEKYQNWKQYQESEDYDDQ